MGASSDGCRLWWLRCRGLARAVSVSVSSSAGMSIFKGLASIDTTASNASSIEDAARVQSPGQAPRIGGVWGEPRPRRAERQRHGYGRRCRPGSRSFVVSDGQNARPRSPVASFGERDASAFLSCTLWTHLMIPTITAFERSPDRGQGLARDMRVRWALEELGQPYEVRLLSFQALKESPHLARNPFGQIPTYEEGELVLFESGAIVLHLAERHPGLLPRDAHARARAVAWLFAALNTVEPPIMELSFARILERDATWYEQRLPVVVERVQKRLGELCRYLGDAEWLDGVFSAADLMMVSVLLRLKPSGMLESYPTLGAYVARGEARPAYQRAFAAQWALFQAGVNAG